MAQKNNQYSGRKLKKPNMRKEGNFTQIPNAFILNPNIKSPELRLLLYIMMYDDNRRITTKNCIKYLSKSKPTIISAFEKLVKLGILKINDEHIEVEIPEEMKKYTLGYFKGKENITENSLKTMQKGNDNFTTEVKKTLPSETDKILKEGKENVTVEVKKSLPSDKENFTTEVKKTDRKPLEDTDSKSVTNPIILSNTTRVLPVPPPRGKRQSHSISNTNGNTGIKLDLECDTLQSQASPSVLAPSLHTPTVEVEKVSEELSLPTGNNNSDILPIEENNSNSPHQNYYQSESKSDTLITEKNDLKLVLESIPHFKSMYDNANWKEIDISNYSNAYLSSLIIEKEKNNKDERISSNAYFFIERLIKHSSRLDDDSNLWMEFQRQCKSENRLDIISKYTHNSNKN